MLRYGYKLFRKNKNGELLPLYVNATKVVPLNEVLYAECGQMTENGKVKSRLGELAYRPGWHLNEDAPFVTHIYSKHKGKKYLKDGCVWCLVEYGGTDYQSEANECGRNKKGKIIAKNAYLKRIPEGGFYRYKTNPNMTGAWIISGEMKVVRELSQEEVVQICLENGYAEADILRPYVK